MMEQDMMEAADHADLLPIFERNIYKALLSRGFSSDTLDDILACERIRRLPTDAYAVHVDMGEETRGRDIRFTEIEELQAIEALYIIGQLKRDAESSHRSLHLAAYLGSLVTVSRITYPYLPLYFPKRTPSRRSKKLKSIDKVNKTRDAHIAEAVKELIDKNPELNQPRKVSEIARRLSGHPEFQGLSVRRYRELVTEILRGVNQEQKYAGETR